VALGADSGVLDTAHADMVTSEVAKKRQLRVLIFIKSACKVLTIHTTLKMKNDKFMKF
jgi:hypothetical protein